MWIMDNLIPFQAWQSNRIDLRPQNFKTAAAGVNSNIFTNQRVVIHTIHHDIVWEK